MKNKILIWSIFAALLMLLVPFTAVAAGPIYDAPKEAIEKPASSTLSYQLPTFNDPSNPSPEELVIFLQAAANMLQDLGDVSTAEAINQELSSILESNQLVMGDDWSPAECAIFKAMQLAYLVLAAIGFSYFNDPAFPPIISVLFFDLGLAALAMADYIQGLLDEHCSGNPEGVGLAGSYSTAISGETYATSGCNLCGGSSSQPLSR